MKPVIAVLPLYDTKRESIWMLPGYHDALMDAGAIPITLPFDTNPDDIAQLLDGCNGVVLTGGDDVSPRLYGEEPSEYYEGAIPERDELDAAVLRAALERDMPIFGICRGIQLMNVVLGGTLYQNLATDHPSSVNHRMEAPYDRPQHRVSLLPNAPLAQLLDAPEIGVNSCHHQAIRDLAPSLKPMAMSEDGLVEAVYSPTHEFVWAVQWHPEFSWRADERQRQIVAAFVQATERHRTQNAAG